MPVTTNVAPAVPGIKVAPAAKGIGAIFAVGPIGPVIAVALLALGTYIGHRWWSKANSEKRTSAIAQDGLVPVIGQSTDKKIQNALDSGASRDFSLKIDNKKVWEKRKSEKGKK
ncbi:MAG: hypothetical protein HN353_07545 [Bdellovibrionales bacterium]|jgi:hypothetical protein|nr:hypothetical protein [Bdellovibrionales bacterium]MBT3526664.1 hypothetical protein [Bdellovibrionales bacterium]MBT7669315.1 hypothetical protein [Bdellovibrionales bacterium]MBT7767996.1 hypothetical protein [Bdellovibrionales bacterium]